MTRIKILLFLLIIGTLNAQNPVLVSDIRLGAGDCVEDWGTSSVQLGEKIFFVANNGSIERGLYKVENDESSLLKDICVGCSSTPYLSVFNNLVYFIASENNMFSLWSTDGSTSNTAKVAEIGESGIDNFFVADNFLYFTSNSSIFVVNKSNDVKKITGINAKFNTNGLGNLDYGKVCKYEDGIAHMTLKSDSILIYKITETAVLLGKTKIENTFLNFHGLNVVSNGLVFVYDDEMYNWRKSSGTVVKNTFSVGNKISRIIPFRLNEPLVYVFSNGYYLLKGSTTLTLTKFSSKWDNLSQNDEIPRTVYNEQMVFFTDDYNSSNDYIITTDGTTANTKENVAQSSYPSNFYNINQNSFFATGTSNGFKPTLYNYNFDSKELTILKNFSQSSLQSNTIMILGVVGKKIYYLGNLDASVGRELFYIETDINTATNDVDDSKTLVHFNLKKSDGNLLVTNEQQTEEKILVYIFGMDGKLYQSFESVTNRNIPLDVLTDMYIIRITDYSGKKVNSKVFVKQE
jgi:hypothetical protein